MGLRRWQPSSSPRCPAVPTHLEKGNLHVLAGASVFGLPQLQVRGFAPLAVQAPGVEQPCSTAGTELLSRCLSAPDNGAEKKQTPSPDRGWFIADNDVSLCMNYSVSQRARG